MTKSDQIKILNDKIKTNNAQYDIDRLNAEISAFSEGDLDKYEFLTRKDLKYKPNALDKANFEFSPLGKAFNQGLDKKAENYKEECVIKLLKDIRMVRPIGGNNGGNGNNDDNGDDNDDNGDDNDDNGDDNVDNGNDNDDNGNDNDDNDEIAETGSIDLSWMNDLQSYRQIASEVFTRYNRDKDSLELFTVRTFIDNINNEPVKNKKDAREEFKTVKKNVKSESLKQIVKDLEQVIFGYNDDKSKEELKAEELDRKFKNLISKKRLEPFKELEEAEELDRNFKNLISKKRLESFKKYLKKAEYIDPQSRVNALRKKLNNLPKTSSDETSDEASDDNNDNDDNDDNNDNNDNNDNDDNNDSEDNQISNFVDRALKKASKEVVNDDNKDDDDDSKNDDNKKLLKLSKENADLKKN